MKQIRRFLLLGFLLTLVSASLYLLQVLLFHRSQETAFYLLQDLAFLPIQVLLVTIVLNEAISRREKSERLKKMNMVIGAFFSEIGNALLRQLSAFDQRAEEMRPHLIVTTEWQDAEYAAAQQYLKVHPFTMSATTGNLVRLKSLLLDHRDMLLRLLENPNLLEHETFTELLWAVNHLTDELWYRDDVHHLSSPDAAHIAGDTRRAYTLLLAEWLAYVKHLHDEYPYIYSLVIRTNPFDTSARVEIL
ncbi:MAG: hypothetical protein ACYDBB_05875 [Armatimonadota bacterium]